MTEKIKEEVERLPAQQTAGEENAALKLSRRSFGKLLGAQAVLVSAASLSACGGGGGGLSSDPTPDDPGTPVDPSPPNGSEPLTRAAFLATISDYFDWPHSSEYKDRFANAQPVFVDVSIGVTPYAKQIETALEEGVVSNTRGYFNPDENVTREDAADMYVKAFLIPAATSNPLAGFTDADQIAKDRLESVKAIVGAGFMGGQSATAFSPQGTLTGQEASEILERITSTIVAPVQSMSKPGTTSPRRYVSYKTPTPGATIYLTETRDGSEPANPATAPVSPDWTPSPGGHGRQTPLAPAGFTASYDPWAHGVRQYTYFGAETASQKPMVYRAKVAALKDGKWSGVREYVWNVFRPNPPWPYEAKLVHARTSTTPAVWQIYNMSEEVQANAYYIEGNERGIIFDFLQYTYEGDAANGMKQFVDTIATKPYVGILGHNHGDHVAQIGSFTDNNIPMYTSPLEKAQLQAGQGGFGGSAATVAAYTRAGDAAIPLVDGQSFDLGGCHVTAWFQPGHADGLVTILINETGWVYATDMWACNRPYTADTTGYSGVKTDLMLSLLRQLWANYLKNSPGGISEVTNAHQDYPVGLKAALNFIATFQNVIDYGAAATRPSIRSAAGSRMGWIHDYGIGGLPDEAGAGDLTYFWGMWHDKNWMANELGGRYSETELDCLTKPTADAGYPTGAAIDYNGTDGYKKYSQLANVEIEGGELAGVDVYWNTVQTAGALERKLSNKFNPWTYAYTIRVPAGAGSIVFRPFPLSTRITSMKVNGADLKWGESVTLPASGTITVDVVAQDGSTASSYTFMVRA